jgi:hypothetical protein
MTPVPSAQPTQPKTSPAIKAATATHPYRRSGDDADPTTRTIEMLGQSMDDIQRELGMRAETRQREHSSLQELIETRLADGDMLSLERDASIRREIDIRETYRRELKSDSETHRLELKSDGEKTLTTATIAAEKAVQAALAAAEKARDQQTIASQLATTKAEEASKDQLKQQGETFSTAINALNVGFNDIKGMLGELRAEKRGGQEIRVEQRASSAQTIALAGVICSLFGGAIAAILIKVFGG